ncbi:MAG: glycyl-radical enzyme activating protein [Sedimentibacter sp.]
MNNLYGYFMEPQNFSVNDGDGIRTTIFFAGCPLRCKWCANPESHEVNNELVKPYSVSQILDIIKRQEIFFRYSGGGVTFSGGEALMQPNVIKAIVDDLYDRAVNMAIETSGYFDYDEVSDILERLDLIFIDIKHMDAAKHKYFTGKSNEIILNNIKRMNELNVPVVVRIPVIVGVNSDNDNIIKTAKFVKKHLNNPKIELLPYHDFGDEKYEKLGLKKPSRNFKRPSNELLTELKKLIENEGIEIVSYL